MTVIRIVKIVSWIVSFFAIIYTINMYYISAKGTAPIDLKKQLIPTRITLLFIIVISGMGLVVSNYSQTMQQAMFVMFFFVIIIMLMSGLFTPINSMPEWAQTITIANPLKYFIQVTRMVYLKGSGFSDLIMQFIALFLMAIALNGWAVFSYKKNS